MNETAGWYLPAADSYFPKFIEGGPPKRNGFMREHLQEAFKHVRKWEVAVDVGAHVGFWTRDMAERFARVYAFEAAGDTFACLSRNMAGFKNVELWHCAVGERAWFAEVQDDPTRIGNTGSRFIRSGQGVLPMNRLDDVGIAACDLLKIDVEGYEWQVLCGAEKLITDHRPVVIMECDKKFASPRYGVKDDAAEKFLLKRGYCEVAHMRPDKVFVA